MDNEKLGFLAIKNGDYQEAVNLFKRAIEQKKSSKRFIGLGLSSYKLGDYDTAKWAFHKAIELEPENKEAFSYLSDIEKIRSRVPASQRQSLFRAASNYLEIYNNRRWSKFFIKGINIGLGLPGYFPGEYPIKMATYLKWFKHISELGINAIRVYTIHPPSFYEALYKFNEGPQQKLYLFQGIWAELPQDNNFDDKNYLAEVRQNIKNAIDVVYGNAKLPERPGYPHGAYDYDVSPITVGPIFGREWESCAVKTFNERRGRKLGNLKGEFLSIDQGSAFEVWVTQIGEFSQSYEYEKYKTSHPISVVNWPTLDPLNHPSESTYEEELAFQGIKARGDICNENEDMESLDLSKIRVEKGAGFFATYHPYPYYPDFMNYDYLEEKNPYLTYLEALKRHHGDQPVLVAEFGVPSSREVTHWHRDGWHHGGHSEAKQGEINGLLMKAIYEAGVAGGILFSWFDEWFKRNWLFSPYEIPAERKPFWFNIQDAEQNYGLMAAYPGYPRRKVNLAGQKDDWQDALTLYEKSGDSMASRFNDGLDEARALTRLMVQHDEGFLYILVETKGTVNLTEAHYLIGIDTSSSENGEFLLPYRTNLLSPIGLKFLISFAGRERSRILTCQPYDKYLNVGKGEINPGLSHQGAWVVMQNRANSRRISKDNKRFYPSQVFSMSTLRFGSLNNKSIHYDSLADFFLTDNIIELRIPWGLMNFTDPSSKMVLWIDKDGKTKKTDGIKIIVVSYKPEKGCLFAKSTGLKNNVTDSLPERLEPENIKAYSWEDWDTPIYHTYLKESYYTYKEVLSKIPE
ncbi:MAG: tetratricopeptide repeat protein [Candidatus Binatia bacterium]